MTKAIAVIGANYGDEGKGATTNFLAKTKRALTVVRFNGGNQAGHTVQLSSGKRHIFSSYSSGTLIGAKTYISDLALFNPKAANEERKGLLKLGVNPRPLQVHPHTHIITPWDIALNQFLERGRGDAKHGSCGMGIGEAMFRKITEEAPKLLAKDLQDPKALFTLAREAREWFKKRLKEEAKKGSFIYLNEQQVEAMNDLVLTPSRLTTELWTYSACMMNCAVQLQSLDRTIHGDEDFILFEGAQGLLLDEDDPDHQPHVTWSKTGLHNIIQECTKYGLDLTEVYYVTRPYLTRHGKGPILAGEEIIGEDPWGIQDLTNKPNDYQGSLRFGHQNWSKLRERIEKDLLQLKDFKPTVKIALTCLDQVEGEEVYRFDHEHGSHHIATSSLISAIQAQLGFDLEVINGLKG
jgi:adenylosuccinate synthase